MSARRPSAPPPPSFDLDRDELENALQSARAAFWLLDQVSIGDVTFLNAKDLGACATMRMADLKDSVQHFAMEALGQALADLVTLIQPDEPGDRQSPPPTPRAAKAGA